LVIGVENLKSLANCFFAAVCVVSLSFQDSPHASLVVHLENYNSLNIQLTINQQRSRLVGSTREPIQQYTVLGITFQKTVGNELGSESY
jgi:hypothetical protein